MYRHDPRCDHCFRGSEPQLFLAESVGFFGSGRCSSRLVQRITQSTSDRQRFIFANPFDRRRCEVNTPYINVNARLLCTSRIPAVNLWKSKSLLNAGFKYRKFIWSLLFTNLPQQHFGCFAYQPIILTHKGLLKHVVHSGVQWMLDLVAYVDGGSL